MPFADPHFTCALTSLWLRYRKAERLFQKKAYKQALRTCDQVYRKNERHGETLSLRGAILGRLAETEEEKEAAINTCKQALKLDFNSKTSWIHLARLYKTNRRYEESIKSMKTALRNPTVTNLEKHEWRRELTFMLAQTRAWDELADIRFQMQVDQRDSIHWIGYW